MKILIIDDDVISRELIQKGLKKAGYGTLEAENAETAIKLLQSEEPIGLTITDIMMPEMDGIALQEKSKRSLRSETSSFWWFPRMLALVLAKKVSMRGLIPSWLHNRYLELTTYQNNPYNSNILLWFRTNGGFPRNVWKIFANPRCFKINRSLSS